MRSTWNLRPGRFGAALAVLASSCALLFAGTTGTATAVSPAAESAPKAATATVPAFDHIFTILMENHSYNEIVGSSQAPYINSLIGKYGLASSYVAASHPSLPNYLALTGSSTFGITTDCNTCFVSAPNIAVDRVEASGRTWKAYMESMPSACFLGDSGEYAQKHNPFVYYDDIRLNATECAKDVPYTQFSTDIASASTTANYVWVTPNLINDMHDGTIAQGDSWLASNVPAILNSPAFTTQNSVLDIVWDEDDGTQGNQVPSIVINSAVTPGYHSTAAYSHYSWQKTIETAWGLAPLTANDTGAAAMSDFFVPQGTQTVPGAPTGATATAGKKSAAVSWTPPANNGGCAITGYTVTSSPGSVSVSVGGTATSATVAGLVAGTSYTFTVTAANCIGTGPASAPSNAVVPRKH
jgi:acid phosphatase